MVKKTRRKMTAAQKKAFVARMKRARNKTYSNLIKSRRGVKMAKKRKKRSYRRSGKIVSGVMGTLLGAAVYGGLRARLSNMVSPLTAKIPLGNIADEVAMLGVGYGAKKLVGHKVPLVKQIANAGMLIEAARIGEATATGQLGITNGASTSSGNIF